MPSEQPTHHGFAVNVKDYETFPRDTGALSDEEVDGLYQDHVQMFWRDAESIAEHHGFQTVYSEGRMGGWCLPVPQPHWPMGGDEVTEWLESKFRPFERDILELVSDCRKQFLTELSQEIERANAEPAERAYWAARDVVTID